MANTPRRNILRAGVALVALPSSVLHFGCVPSKNSTSSNNDNAPDDRSTVNVKKADPTAEGAPMQIQYLEIVTAEVDAVCATYSQLHGMTFGEGDPNLGGARTAKLASGGMLGIRAPMHAAEKPVVRPYILVEDIEATVAAAADAGAKIALQPMKLGDHGTCAIMIQGEIESGLWQL